MSKEYDEYLDQHIKNVKKGYNYIKKNLPELLKDIPNDINMDSQIKNHDKSKYSSEEYEAYDEYFYGKKTSDVKKNFDVAWLHHQKENPHHWQYWILINDEDVDTILDMPYNYIVEMLCDNWAFSWKENNLYEIFNWYKNNKSKIKFSSKTRKVYENLLNRLKSYLDDYQYDS